MFFRVTGHAKTETLLRHLCRELIRIMEAVGMRFKRCLSPRWVSAQGENIFNAAAAQVFKNRADFGFGMPHAGEMRHRFDAEFIADARDQIQRFRPRAAAGAVGDRHVVRFQEL